MDTGKKKEFVRPRITRRREKLASIVQFATGGNATEQSTPPKKDDS